jgi:Nucleotide modification associated domain 1
MKYNDYSLKQFEQEARKLMNEALTLLVNKRKDYGPNALKGGVHGIAIRMSDKMARLENLLGIADGSFKSKNAIVGDEKIEDTFRDLINYGILALIEIEKKK